MTVDWTTLLTQAPLVAVFVIFVLKLQEYNSSHSEKQHTYWQQWLTEQQKTAEREREDWRQFIQARDDQSRIERQELLTALKAIEMQLESLTNFTMLTYFHVTPDKDEIIDNLKKFTAVRSDEASK